MSECPALYDVLSDDYLYRGTRVVLRKVRGETRAYRAEKGEWPSHMATAYAPPGIPTQVKLAPEKAGVTTLASRTLTRKREKAPVPRWAEPGLSVEGVRTPNR